MTSHVSHLGKFLSFPGITLPPAVRMFGKKGDRTMEGGAHEKTAVVLTKVQENLLLPPLHEQLVVGQEVCILLLLDLLNDGFCLLEQRHGRATGETSPSP